MYQPGTTVSWLFPIGILTDRLIDLLIDWLLINLPLPRDALP